jgi:hypothetical protein
VACVCAAGGAVGLDLEPHGAAGIADLRLALGEAERARLGAGELDPTTAWVMVEAVLKAAGLGIDAAPRVRLEGQRASIDGTAFHLTRAALGAAHVAFVAHEPRGVCLEVVCHDAAEFAPLP